MLNAFCIKLCNLSCSIFVFVDEFEAVDDIDIGSGGSGILAAIKGTDVRFSIAVGEFWFSELTNEITVPWSLGKLPSGSRTVKVVKLVALGGVNPKGRAVFVSLFLNSGITNFASITDWFINFNTFWSAAVGFISIFSFAWFVRLLRFDYADILEVFSLV